MRVLLLGGAGYLGGRLAQFLKSAGHEICVTTRRRLSEAPGWLCADRVVQSDLNDESALAELVAGADVVLQLAAPDQATAQRRPVETLQFGVGVSWRVLSAMARAVNQPAYLYVSTYHVYGRNLRGTVTEETTPAPVHPYALSKLLAEGVVQFFRRQGKVRGLCVRLSNAFGAPAGREVTQWSLVFNDLCRQAVSQRKLVLRSSGVQRRNFITMGDAVRGIEHLAANPRMWPDDGLIHLGSSICLSVREVAEIVAERSVRVLGFRPAIAAPEPAPGEVPVDLDFRVDRLAQTGFRFTNELEREIDDTLRLCLASESPAADTREPAVST